MQLRGLLLVLYMVLIAFNDGSQCKDALPTHCDCQSSETMDIIFTIDTTCFSTHLSDIKAFIVDLIQENYFTSNTRFGFVLFNNEYINSTSIQHWTNTDIKYYINNHINNELDLVNNRNIANAVNASIQLFKNASTFTETQRILVIITHKNPSKSQDICQYSAILQKEEIDVNIIKIWDVSSSGYECILPITNNHWLYVDYWSESNFNQIYPYLKFLFCIMDSTTASPLTIQESTAEYLLTIRNTNIWTQYSTENTIRNKLTLAIQNYFSINVAFSYSITIEDIDYDFKKKDSNIVFIINKAGYIGWSDDEVNDIYASYEDAQFFYVLMYYLDIEWDINGVIKTADDILSEFNQGNEMSVKRDLMNLLLTDFPTVSVLIPTTTTTTTVSVFIEPPRLLMAEYDIKTGVLSVEFDRSMDYDSMDCMDILTVESMYVLGYEASCVWMNNKKIFYSIGNDNTLFAKILNNNAYIEFKTGVIVSYDDTNIVQMNSIHLKSVIIFINNDNLQIAAIIDGVTATTICNDLYYSSSRSLGHYGASLEYRWEVIWNNSVIYADHHDDTLTLSVVNDILQYMDISLVTWPILIEIRLHITNWLSMNDTTSYYTWIKNDYSLGIIHVIGDQFKRKMAYNLKHKFRAISHVSICNVSFTNNTNTTITESKVYSTLLSQYEVSYKWRMVDDPLEVQTILLDPNHYIPNTFRTVYGDVISSTITTLYSDAYSLIPFGNYLFEISVQLFNSTNKDYVSAQILPPNIYVKPSIFKIISSDSGVNISANDLFSIKDPYSTVMSDPYNLSLSNMLSDPTNGYILEWKCFSKYLTNSESSNIINEFKTDTINGYKHYNVSAFDSCDDHLTFDSFIPSLSFGVGELLISNKYVFEMSLYDPFYDMRLFNYYMFWINPGLLPIVTIHTSQLKHQRRKQCNADGNRIVFVAEIENLEQLKSYYNLNDDPTDNIKAYLKSKKSSSSSSDSSDSDEEYEDIMESDYKYIDCNWYSNDVDLQCKQIIIQNNKLMIKQKSKHGKRKKQCIVDGGVYTFNVECVLDNGLIGSSSITIGTNNAPFGGYCYFKEYGNQYTYDDTIVIELDPMEYQTELTVICMNWNDEHIPLTQNIRTVYPALIDTCLSYAISSASSVDWNKCKGSYIGEFEQGDNQLILGLGEYLLIAVIRDDLEYDAVYKLPALNIMDPVFDLSVDTSLPTPQPSLTTTMTATKPTVSRITDTQAPINGSIPIYHTTTVANTPSITATTTTSIPARSPLNIACNESITESIQHNIKEMIKDLDYITQHLSQLGDTQIFFQVLQSMSSSLDHYIDHYGYCLAVDMKQLIFSTKIRIIELAKIIMNHTSTTKTYDNLENQLNVISNILNLFCAGPSAYNDSCTSSTDNNDYSSCITSSDILAQSSKTLTLLSEYFTENESMILFGIVEELVEDVLALDEFQDDVLDQTISDILMDIISSIHIWLALNVGANSEYDDLENITHLIRLITSKSVSNSTSIINENTYWSSCWMNIDLSLVQLNNMSMCNGYYSHILWPSNITHYLDDIYDILSTVNCFVSEIIYDNELLLNIELIDNDNDINVTLRNDTDTYFDDEDNCDGIEFTICNTEHIYTLLNTYDHPLLSEYNVPICQWSLLDKNKDANDIWNTSGCYVVSYTSSCVTCICTHLTLFKADAEEFEPQINIVTESSFHDITTNHIGEHPVPLIFVLLSSALCIFSWIASIKCCKQKDNTPLVAVPDIINKSIKTKMINESGYALSLVEIHRKDIGLCSKICNVFMFYMKDYHPILSIFASTKHTNYSVTQRIFCCFMYIMTVCAVSALFYGQKKETVIGSLVLMIWSSLLTCIPIYFVIYLFQFSRSMERDSEIKKAIINAKLLKAPCHQLSSSEIKQLSLELCAKWLISEMSVNSKEIDIRMSQIPMIYPDQSSEHSMDSVIPPLPESTRPAAESITAPPAPPPKRAAPPPPNRAMNPMLNEDDEYDIMAHELLMDDEENIPLAHSLMHEIEGEEESETPPWVRQPPSWNVPSKPSMNAPKPMILEHSYDVLKKEIDIDDHNSDDEKLQYLPDTTSKKKRILMNAVGIIESEMVRKRLLKAEYPLPHCMKNVSWTFLMIWNVFCMLLIVIYGAHFDLVYESCAASKDNDYKCSTYDVDNNERRLVENECFWEDSLNDRVNEDIMEYISDIINSDDFALNGIPDHDNELLIDGGITYDDDQTDGVLIGDVMDNRLDIYGADITDSSKWIISCFVTLLIGFILWQPLWLYLIAFLSVEIPSFGALKCSQMLCPYCFRYFRKLDQNKDDEEMLLSKKLNINIKELLLNKVNNDNNKVNALNTRHFSVNSNSLSKPKQRIKQSFSMKFKSNRNKSISSERNRKRLQREQELSDHYREDSKIVENVQPTILSSAMISLQQRQSQTFDESTMSRFSSKTNEQKRRSAIYYDEEKLEEKEEEYNVTTDDDDQDEEEQSKSSDLFGVGDDDIVYFEHANNRHRRDVGKIFDFTDFIINDDEYDLSIDTDQFLSDIKD